MRAWLLAAVSVFAVASLGFVHPFGDPRSAPAKGLGTLLNGANIPPSAREVLISKCADCHSRETRWPAYARIAPGSWLIERDIVDARKHLDLSHWRELSKDRQDLLRAKILKEARSGRMPPVQYLTLHPEAKLSHGDIEALSLLGKSPVAPETTPAAAEDGDAGRGEAMFQKRCTGCHALGADREGPRLAGVFGRKIGSVPGFNYSAGVKNLGITWNEATLDRWLTDPDLMVPDNQMSISMPKAQNRRDLIAFLKTKH